MNMPNGTTSSTYNPAWCKQKHDDINQKYDKLDQRIEKMDNRIYGLIILALLEAVGIATILLMTVIKE